MRINESTIRRIIREEAQRVLLEYVPSSTSDETMAKDLFKNYGLRLGYGSRDEVEKAVRAWQEQNEGKPEYHIPTENLFSNVTGAVKLIPPNMTYRNMHSTGVINRILGMNKNLAPDAKLHLILHHWAIEGGKATRRALAMDKPVTTRPAAGPRD